MNVIFDMDGVIFDTERLCLRTWQEAAEEYGMTKDTAEKIFSSCVGTTMTKTEEIIRRALGSEFPFDSFRRQTSSLFHEIAEKEGLPMMPGAAELLKDLKENGAKIGLASSTRLAVVEEELQNAGLIDYFDSITGGDQLRQSKPAPDIYLLACERLGVQPGDTYAIEDSYNGIRSAAAAGMHAIMVPDMLAPTEEMEKLAEYILPDLYHVGELLLKKEEVQHA